MNSKLPLGWESRSLEAICDKVSVGHVGETSSFFVETGGVPFIRSQNVRPSKVDFSDIKFITPEFHRKSKKSQLEGGDLLIVRVGQNRGDCAVLPKNLGEVNCANIVFARPKPPYSDFLGSYFNTPRGRQALLALSSGSAQLVLNTKSIAKLEVPVPPPGEALAIGTVNKLFDDRITLLRETSATLEAIAQAIFKSWFVDFDPVRARQRGRVPEGMDEATAALFPDGFQDSEIGPIPSGWRTGTLASLADLNPESWTSITRPEKIQYIDLANAKCNEIDEIACYSFDDAPSRARRVLRVGDTVVGTVRPGNRSFAYIYSAPSNLTGSTGFAVLRPRDQNCKEFIYIAATREESIDQLAHLADGGAYPAVRPEVVSSLRTILPCPRVLGAFHAIAGPIFLMVGENKAREKSLAAVRDELLPHLISGQLRLPSVQALPKQDA